MRIHLNGWLRLWIVISVLWVAIASITLGPSTAQIYRQAQYEVQPTEGKLHELLDIIEQAKAEKDQATAKVVAEAYRRGAAGPITVAFSAAQSSDERAKIVDEEIGPAIFAAKPVPNPYDTYVKSKGPPAIKLLMAVCCGPPLALLLLGWSFAWVRKGFLRPG